VEKDVGRFDIAMDDIGLMQFVETLEHVVSNVPNLLFRDSVLGSYGFLDAALNNPNSTCKSPWLAYSITIQSISEFSS